MKVIPINRKKTMPKFRIDYDVRYINGQVEIEAADEAEARKKFDTIPVEDLVEKSVEVVAEIESVEAA